MMYFSLFFTFSIIMGLLGLSIYYRRLVFIIFSFFSGFLLSAVFKLLDYNNFSTEYGSTLGLLGLVYAISLAGTFITVVTYTLLGKTKELSERTEFILSLINKTGIGILIIFFIAIFTISGKM